MTKTLAELILPHDNTAQPQFFFKPHELKRMIQKIPVKGIKRLFHICFEHEGLFLLFLRNIYNLIGDKNAV
ncbi:UNVERIFIED_CONTAM: hypothetical protein ITH36_25285 [Salmonella enterica subsp. enterica serovar Weltevreden]